MQKYAVGHLADLCARAIEVYRASDVDDWIKKMMLDTEESNLEALYARIAELERDIVLANDAAAKGDLARANAGGMEMRIKELEETLREAMGWNWLDEASPPPQEIIDQCNSALGVSRL